MPGPFRTRADEIAALRKRTPRHRIPFPDLSVEQRTSRCSDKIAVGTGALARKSAHPDAACFPVGHSHKQGLQLITPAMLTNGELQWMSGRKT